ncbi:MAG: hypothetical protein ACTHK1_01560 [Actinomycetales bacterium]
MSDSEGTTRPRNETADGRHISAATSIGQTGGLPGDNSDPRAAYVADDELASTTALGEETLDDQVQDDVDVSTRVETGREPDDVPVEDVGLVAAEGRANDTSMTADEERQLDGQP